RNTRNIAGHSGFATRNATRNGPGTPGTTTRNRPGFSLVGALRLADGGNNRITSAGFLREMRAAIAGFGGFLIARGLVVAVQIIEILAEVQLELIHFRSCRPDLGGPFVGPARRVGACKD